MSTYKFNRYNDLIDFLFNAKKPTQEFDFAFDEWEALHVSVFAPLGLELQLNTKTIDTSGNAEYMTWKKVKHIVKAFLSQDIPQEFSNQGWHEKIPFQISNLDIRLKCPKSMKDNIDQLAEYDSFRLSFLVNSGIIVATATSIEKGFPASIEPIQVWESNVSDIIRKWELDNLL